MEASDEQRSDDVKTFRGRSLEEVLPQIRAELGPDAIVLRRREGLAGGVGGFFQRPYVEVDARAPARRTSGRSRSAATARRPRACASPGRAGAVRAGDAVRRRARRRRARRAAAGRLLLGDGRRRRRAEPQAAQEPPRSQARRRPARRRAAPASTARSPNAAGDRATPTPRRRRPSPRRRRSPSPRSTPEPEPRARRRRAVRRAAGPPRARPPRRADPRARPPAAADAAEQRLVAAGLSPALAADVVGEAVAHGLPFTVAAQHQEARPRRARAPHRR